MIGADGDVTRLDGRAPVPTAIAIAIAALIADPCAGRGIGGPARDRNLPAVDSTVVVWGVIAVVIVVGLGFAWSLASAKARDALRQRYAGFAAANGLQYVAEAGDKNLFERFDQSILGMGGEKPFGRGHGQRAGNVVWGTVRAHEICGFTYTYRVTHTNGKTTSTSTYHWSVVTVALPAALPPVEVADDGLFDTLGLAGVQFESEAFNDRFRVSCDDARYASALVHTRMMELMLARQHGITRVRGDVVVNVEEREAEPDELAATWNYLIDLVELVPPFVIADYGQPTPGTGRDR